MTTAKTCPVCGNVVDESAQQQSVGTTAHGAREVDPTKGTRRFHNGKWYSFDTIDCRSKFMIAPDKYAR